MFNRRFFRILEALSLVFYFYKKWKTIHSSFSVFHFHEEIEKRIILKNQD